MAEDLLFKGLKVVDVATWIAAPVAATMLADFGAEVIKVEIPGAGDPYRAFSNGPGLPQSPLNYCWLMDARNKRSLSLNLKTEPGKKILHQLVKDCDIYITNQPLAMRRSLGLTYEDLQPLNPRMIYASLTAYGEEGPERDREGFDLVAYWSRTGLMDLVRADGAPPAQSLPGMGDHPTAVALYAAILTGLLRREKTGKGSLVHTSLIANGLWSASCIAQAKFVDADFTVYRTPGRMSLGRALCETADGRWLQFTMVRTPEEIQGLFRVMGVEGLLADPRFNTPENRLSNGVDLVAILRPIFKSKTSEQWMSLFGANKIPVALTGVIEDLPNDPQLRINNIITKASDEGITDGYVVNHPVHVQGMPRVGPTKAPEVGEHSSDILRELGYTDGDVAALRVAGVL